MFPQVCQVSAQQPVQTELLMRFHQLQSRLATLKIENEEVSEPLCPVRDFLAKAWLVRGVRTRQRAHRKFRFICKVDCRTAIKTVHTRNLSWSGECSQDVELKKQKRK